jgi:branched-chain amino acid transport system ATP-binding protein
VTLLEVQSLKAAYGDLSALWDVSLQVEQGEIVALIGPNGAGKTTLLRTIVGLHRPASGSIALDGKPIHTIPAHQLSERGLTLVPEGRRLFGGMSVLENLLVGAHCARARAHKERSLKQVFEIFPILAERRHSPAGMLSGGMQQMVAIGRALMGMPRLLLLDEPSLGLAPLVVKNIFEVVARVNREGVTVLLVEQNARSALELAQRAYILEQGRITAHSAAAAMLKDANVRRAYLG